MALKNCTLDLTQHFSQLKARKTNKHSASSQQHGRTSSAKRKTERRGNQYLIVNRGSIDYNTGTLDAISFSSVRISSTSNYYFFLHVLAEQITPFKLKLLLHYWRGRVSDSTWGRQMLNDNDKSRIQSASKNISVGWYYNTTTLIFLVHGPDTVTLETTYAGPCR